MFKVWVKFLTLVAADKKNFDSYFNLTSSLECNRQYDEIQFKQIIPEILQITHCQANDYFWGDELLKELLDKLKYIINNLVQMNITKNEVQFDEEFEKLRTLSRQIFDTQKLIPINLGKPICLDELFDY